MLSELRFTSPRTARSSGETYFPVEASHRLTILEFTSVLATPRRSTLSKFIGPVAERRNSPSAKSIRSPLSRKAKESKCKPPHKSSLVRSLHLLMDADVHLRQDSQQHDGFIRIYVSYGMEHTLCGLWTNHHQHHAWRGSRMRADGLEDR